MLRMLIHNWWLFVCRAILALIFAAYLWFIQGANFPLLMHAFANASAVSLFGLLAFSAGMITLLAMLRPSNRGHGRGLLLLDGVGNCVAAAIAVLAPALGLGHLIAIIAVWAIYIGLCELLVAIGLKGHMLGEWLLLIA